MTIKPGDKKRRVPTLPRQRPLNPMLSSRRFILLMGLMILAACAPARTSVKGLDRVGVAVCGPDGFTSVNEGGVAEDVAPGGNKGA
jgi:hypothetical protein